MRIDAHQHFWTFDPAEHGWITDAMPELRRDFRPGDLGPLLRRQGLDGCIAVQARQSLEETRWLLALARRHSFIRGVVGWADLRSPGVDADLESLAADPRLRGIRHLVQDEPDDAFLLREDFRRGVGRLRRFGLVYDILIHPRHLPAAIRFADALPEQPFVLDHLAKPWVKDRVLEPWRAEIRELARRPHVAVKLSGLVTEAAWKRWSPADFDPYLDAALEAFGEDRLLFGSDWPVCLLSASYEQVHDLVASWAATRLSAAARARLFGGNAVRIYGIDS